jgi:hypothetical protein
MPMVDDSELDSICPEQARLLNELNVAVDNYGNAVKELMAKMGVLPQAEYRRMCRNVEEMAVNVEHVRAALIKHRNEHGC